jgi:hypothetical protein
MTGRERARRTVDIGEAQELFGSPLAQIVSGDVTVILQQNGKDVAALVSAHDLARLESFERLRAERYTIVEELQARFAHMDPEEVERDIAEAIAEVRAEARAKAAATAPTSRT